MNHVLDYVTDSHHTFMVCRPCNWKLDITGKTGDWLGYYWHLHRHGTEIAPARELAKAVAL